MSKNKMLLNQGVLTRGAGMRRAVLDFASCIVYQYSDPSNVLAFYAPGKGWVIRKAPHYTTGGWGHGGTGDSDGGILNENARDLIRAISGRLYRLNFEQFLEPSEIRALNKAIARQNALAKRQNALAKKLNNARVYMDKVEPVKRLAVELDTRYSEHSRGMPHGPKGLDAIETAKKYKTAVQVFLTGSGRPVSIGGYTVKPNLITQTFSRDGSENALTVAFRDAQGQVFMNSQVLDVSTFEREFMGSQSLIQSEVRKVAKYSIPFNILAAADLQLSETRVLEQGPESKHNIKNSVYDSRTTERHFTGALLLENGGRKFFMDIDRVEIENGLWNPFFVEVHASVTSIEGAYASMEPQEVKDAKAQSLEVRRQGEWFFIKTDKTVTVPEDKVLQWDRSEKETNIVLRHQISHGKGRPNNLFRPVGFGELDTLVCGTVSHTGREHADLNLGSESFTEGEIKMQKFQLWRVVPNTTVGNFTITGDID